MAVLIYFDNIVLDWENYLHQGAWDEISESGWYNVLCKAFHSVYLVLRGLFELRYRGLFEFGYQRFKLGICSWWAW